MTTNSYPRMMVVRQRFPESPALNLPELLAQRLAPAMATLRPGAKIAVAVGSRGVTNLALMVAELIRRLKAAGAQPFIVPAMGSHGGGTPEGQIALLAGYGVTEAAMDAPIHAAMDVRRLGTTADGFEVDFARTALEADAVVLLNRIKPHTDFGGQLGSGLLKMLVVGLGKQAGAARFHRAASLLGHEVVIRSSARLILERVRVLAAVAVLEDQRHQTAEITVVAPDQLEVREAELCAQARAWMPQLPLAEVDLLIVDRLGKNISGTGMDPAVIGRMIHGYSLDQVRQQLPPRVHRLFVRELTPESRGNAIGLGLADFTTSRLVRAVDWRVTYMNALTALSLQGAKVPIHFETDREVITHALATLPLADPTQARVVRMADTLSLEQLAISEACVSDLALRSDLVAAGPLEDLSFDAAGNLLLLPGEGTPRGSERG